MSVLIREATLEDAADIRNIYAPIVEETPISFETEVPSVEDIRSRIASLLESHAYFVVEETGSVAAFAYGGSYRQREAYRHTTETSLYVSAGQQGKGIGLKLYTHLLERLKDIGFHTAVAALYVPNPASVAIHKKAGFQLVGRLEQVGLKFEKWHDVEWWQKPLSRSENKVI